MVQDRPVDRQTKCQCFWVAARWPLAAKCHLNWDTCFSFILLLVSYFVVVSFLDSPHPPPPHFLILSALHHRSAWIMDRIGREILPLPDEVTLRRCMKANWINGDLLRLVRTESVLGAEFVQAVCVCVCVKPPIAAFTSISLSCLLNPLVLYACLCDRRLSKSDKWNHMKAWENMFADQSRFSFSKSLQRLFLFRSSPSAHSRHNVSVKPGTVGRITGASSAYRIPYGSPLRTCTRIRYIWFNTLSARAKNMRAVDVSRRYLAWMMDRLLELRGPTYQFHRLSAAALFTACRNRYCPFIIILMGPSSESWK